VGLHPHTFPDALYIYHSLSRRPALVTDAEGTLDVKHRHFTFFTCIIMMVVFQDQIYQQIMGMFMKITIDAGSMAYSREPSADRETTQGYR